MDATIWLEACEHSIRNHNFMFITIDELVALVNNSLVDIIIVGISISPLLIIMRKNGIKGHKRTLQLNDMLGYIMEIMLWGFLCNRYNPKKYVISNISPIILLRLQKSPSLVRYHFPQHSHPSFPSVLFSNIHIIWEPAFRDQKKKLSHSLYTNVIL